MHTPDFLFWFSIITGVVGTVAAVIQCIEYGWRRTARIAAIVVLMMFLASVLYFKTGNNPTPASLPPTSSVSSDEKQPSTPSARPLPPPSPMAPDVHKRPSTISRPDTTKGEPPVKAEAKATKPLTVVIRPGSTTVTYTFPNATEKTVLEGGEVRAENIRTPEDFEKALKEAEKANDKERQAQLAAVKARAIEYARTHVLFQGKRFAIEDFPKPLAPVDKFIDFADMDASNPKAAYENKDGEVYYLAKDGKTYSKPDKEFWERQIKLEQRKLNRK